MREIQRDWVERPAVIYGLMRWNRRAVTGMLSDLPGKPAFARSFDHALQLAQKRQASLFAWTTRLSDDQRLACQKADVPIVHIEDGFVRSVGLGAAFVPAASLIFDAAGIYYDPSRPSDLEWMLEHQDVSETESRRGEYVRQMLVDRGVSKYNLGPGTLGYGHKALQGLPQDKEIILVPGQVSDDASILSTKSQSLQLSSGRNPNLLLLEQVRADNPDAFIIFKPHPDVQSKLRNGALSDSDQAGLANRIVMDGDILDLIQVCDKVETISSLTGFEALLRNKPVVVHGQPFYSGWGLTEDRTSCARRTRQRGLGELVFLTLCQYPRYADPVSSKLCDCEEVIEALSSLRSEKRHTMGDQIRIWLAQIGHRLGL